MAHSLSSLQIDYTKIPPRSGLLEQTDAPERIMRGLVCLQVNSSPGYPWTFCDSTDTDSKRNLNYDVNPTRFQVCVAVPK